MPKDTCQYTIRGVPARVDRALRARSAREGTSLNQLAIEALRLFAGVEPETRGHDDLDDLAGQWVEDPEVDASLKEQRRVDEHLWR